MMITKNPIAVSGRDRVLKKIDVLGQTVDIQNPTEIHPEYQSELLAVRSVMRRFRVSFHHAKTICQLSGLGGAAA